MRKLYALLAGLALLFASVPAHSKTVTPDIANFTFAINPGNNVAFTNTSILGSEPGLRRAYWSFGDGTGQVTGPLDGTQHHYVNAGPYAVCLRIYRYTTISGDSVLSAQVCLTFTLQASCQAGFQLLGTSPGAVGQYFVALPSHSENKKPVRICWTFGDGRDTCIQYSTTYTGNYAVYHLYSQPGVYNVCVNILYDGGCEAQNCRPVEITGPATCGAGFDVIAASPTSPSQGKYFIALPSHSQNKKPVRICWTFGDGRDTCIQYLTTYTGNYAVYHLYSQPGVYNVCVNILYDGGCQAQSCHAVEITSPDTCGAGFEVSPSNSTPTGKYFIALPSHSQNKKPVRICWTFGDGRDTCIQYSTTYTGAYAVYHQYNNAGVYTVCVNILYDGGCQAQNCRPVEVIVPATCGAGFNVITATGLQTGLYFNALPSHSQNKKPVRICWTFGDGRDTCIQYSTTYTGNYAVYHQYNNAGVYTVCVNILYDGGCQAQNCRPVEVTLPDYCRADFERIPLTGANSPLNVYFNALPWHSNNNKPTRICWTFGDGRDTCIQYSNTFTGPYPVFHMYTAPGNYQVCVNILYQGGCEAHLCKPATVANPDSCRADFERLQLTPVNTPLSVIYQALPWNSNNSKPARICWNFGDGRDTCITYLNIYNGQYTVPHTYTSPGLYQVCINILYYGGCNAYKCKPIEITRPDSCRADYETIPSPAGTQPWGMYFRALPWHNNNNKPARICWTFGDGRDTCINYTASYTGGYAVFHRYLQPGMYEVCVDIIYFGGCEARKCNHIQVGPPDSCSADFEIIPVTGANPLLQGFKAIPFNNNNRKPARVCWTFGDGRDTCITYPETFTGIYGVSHRYDHGGQYQVCVNILYWGGCEANKCKVVVIQPVPNDSCTVRLQEITPSITSLIRGFYAVPNITPTHRFVRICWYFGDGTDTCVLPDPLQPMPIGGYFMRHTYPAPGVYRACVRVLFEGGCVAENCIEVVIRGAASICGGYMTDSLIGPRSFLFKGFSIHSPIDNVLSYTWSFGDGTSQVGNVVTHTYTQPGNYQVCLLIRTRLGCETRICRVENIAGTNITTLHLSPNPVVNILHVQFFSTLTEQVVIKIINSSGFPVRTYIRNVTTGNNNWDIDLGTLPMGVYSFVLQSPNQLASAIFLKQ